MAAGIVQERGAVRVAGARIEYALVRSRRRKRTLQLTFDVSEGVVVRAPMRTSRKAVEDFVRERAPWIVRASGNAPGGHAPGGKATDGHPQGVPLRVGGMRRRRFVSGESLLYLGRELTLAVEEGRTRAVRVSLARGSLRVVVPEGLNGAERRPAMAQAIETWYRERAQGRMEARVKRWEGAVGHSASRVIVRDQKTRWGTCGPDGTLRFNWRLVMADASLIDYVAVHELAHLGVRDHSQAFWSAVGAVLPDYKLRRTRLREAEPHLSL